MQEADHVNDDLRSCKSHNDDRRELLVLDHAAHNEVKRDRGEDYRQPEPDHIAAQRAVRVIVGVGMIVRIVGVSI